MTARLLQVVEFPRYYGQHIAFAVAETFETAKAAADAVRATYSAEKPNVAPLRSPAFTPRSRP